MIAPRELGSMLARDAKKPQRDDDALRLPAAKKWLAGLVRLERTTIDLEGRCSIQLSYSPISRYSTR